MGAEFFECSATGRNPDEAFRSAFDEAAWECGHGGYTGTIAEKSSFVMIEPVGDDTAEDILRKYHAFEDGKWNGGTHEKVTSPYDKLFEQVEDKWGPAGCTLISGNAYLFFGWASS